MQFRIIRNKVRNPTNDFSNILLMQFEINEISFEPHCCHRSETISKDIQIKFASSE